MATFTVNMIHPNANADHARIVNAKSAQQAENIAREQVRREYGPKHLFMVGGSTKR